MAESEYDKKYDNKTIMESDLTPIDVLAIRAKPACNTGFFMVCKNRVHFSLLGSPVKV